MADTVAYFGDPKRATYPDGTPIVVNGRPLLIPENFDLQNEINAASYAATNPILNWLWYHAHHALGSRGDPQRQAGYWGGFDPRFTDAGNYGFGLSAAAAGTSLDKAITDADRLNKAGTGRGLPKVNENAIRQAYDDFATKRFRDVDHNAGAAYLWSALLRDGLNGLNTPLGFLNPTEHLKRTDVERYALNRWGNLDSPEAKAFMANFEQAFGAYGLDGSPGDTTSLPGVAGLGQAASPAMRRCRDPRQVQRTAILRFFIMSLDPSGKTLAY